MTSQDLVHKEWAAVAEEKANRRGRPPLSERRRAQTRAEIAREAARLFLERGVAGTSAADIAAAAGVSTRTFWHYFGTKEEAVLPLFASVLSRVAEVFERRPAAEPLLVALGQAARRNAAETPEADTLVDLVRLADVEPGLRRAWLQANNEAEAALTQAIARRCGGDPASPQVRLQAAMAAAAIRVVAEDFAHEASPSPARSEALVHDILLLAGRGLAGG
nr:TetR/AcrR family transcriptional regulator [Streptomyces sp. SID4926]